LAHWIDQLEYRALEHSIRLLLLRVDLHLTDGKQGAARLLLKQVERLLPDQPEFDQQNLQAAFLIAQATLSFQMGDYVQARVFSQQALTLLPADEIELRGKASLRLGVCLCVSGDPAVGIAHLQRTLLLWKYTPDVRQMAQLHSALSNAYDMLDNSLLSLHHCTRALQFWERLRDEAGKINCLNSMGVTKLRQGAYSESEAVYLQVLELSREQFQRGKAYALIGLAGVYQKQHLYERSLAILEDGLELAVNWETTI